MPMDHEVSPRDGPDGARQSILDALVNGQPYVESFCRITSRDVLASQKTPEPKDIGRIGNGPRTRLRMRRPHITLRLRLPGTSEPGENGKAGRRKLIGIVAYKRRSLGRGRPLMWYATLNPRRTESIGGNPTVDALSHRHNF